MRSLQSYLLLALLAVIAILLIAGCKAEQQSPPQASAPPSEAQEPEPPQPSELPAAPPAETGQETEKIEAVTSNEVRMTIYHTAYEPSAIKVKKGSTVKIMATSQPVAHRHGITIDELGLNEPVLSGDQNNPTVITFLASQAGTFRIYCRTCWDGPFGKDHPDIQATLIVED